MEIQQSLMKLNHNNTLVVDLEYKAIDNLAPLIPILARFTKLRELNLHGNRLKVLPDDLSTLKTLESLDISNNMFTNIA